MPSFVCLHRISHLTEEVKQLREELRAVQAEAEAARALAARWEADATALHAEKLEVGAPSCPRLNRMLPYWGRASPGPYPAPACLRSQHPLLLVRGTHRTLHTLRTHTGSWAAEPVPVGPGGGATAAGGGGGGHRQAAGGAAGRCQRRQGTGHPDAGPHGAGGSSRGTFSLLPWLLWRLSDGVRVCL